MESGLVARTVEGKSSFRMLTGKPTGKRPLAMSRRRCEESIIINKS